MPNRITEVTEEDGERLFARSSFYAEFAPLQDHRKLVDTIYVLRDRGRLTADRLTFASPLRELAFTFRETAGRAAHHGKVVVNEPSFGHRKKGQAFFGWIIGVKFKPTWTGPLRRDDPMIVACQHALARIVDSKPSQIDVLDALDTILCVLLRYPNHDHPRGEDYFETAQDRVSDLARRVGGSVRTLHRRVRTSTGLPPKRFLSMQRFRRAVYEIATQHGELSTTAVDLGFSDQAHLTREFRRHAGMTPGTFKQAWRQPHARAVRFVQDAGQSTRLTMAVWPFETTTKSV